MHELHLCVVFHRHRRYLMVLHGLLEEVLVLFHILDLRLPDCSYLDISATTATHSSKHLRRQYLRRAVHGDHP